MVGRQRGDVAPLIAVLLAAAHAATWWVGDAADAAALSTALDEVWPGHVVVVAVGPPDPARDPVWLRVEEGELVLHQPDTPPRRAPVADWWTRAALARSWLRPATVAAMPPPPPRPSPPSAPPPPARARTQVWAAALAGPGARYPTARPVVRVFAATGVRWGAWSLGMGLDGEGGEVLPRTDASALQLYRFGVGPVLDLRTAVRAGADLGLAVRPGFRALIARSVLDPAEAALWLVPDITVGAVARRRGPAAVQPTARVDLVVSGTAPMGATTGDVLSQATGVPRGVGAFLTIGAELARSGEGSAGEATRLPTRGRGVAARERR